MEGVRRLTCVTGYEANNAASEADELRKRIADCFKLEGTFLTEELRSISIIKICRLSMKKFLYDISMKIFTFKAIDEIRT